MPYFGIFYGLNVYIHTKQGINLSYLVAVSVYLRIFRLAKCEDYFCAKNIVHKTSFDFQYHLTCKMVNIGLVPYLLEYKSHFFVPENQSKNGGATYTRG